jgi:signal transduction histidine kinase
MGTPGSVWSRRILQQDVLLALGVAVLMLLGSAVTVEEDLWTEVPRADGPLLPGAGVAALLLAGSLPLALRRVAPVPVLALCVAASMDLGVVGEATPLPLGVLVALFTVAVRHRPLVGVCAAAVYLGLVVAGIATGLAPISDDLFYVYLIALVATVTLAYGVALSRMRASMAERTSAELAAEQEERTRAAVAQEQGRIAREVHDIVAHDVSVIVAQAAAAQRLLPPDSPPATTFRAIETVARDALDGLRRLLNLVRTEDESTRTPQPTLEGLPELVAQVNRAGLPVDLVTHGEVRRLSGTVETNAYRIVQEALTNALKHAGPARATVDLDYGRDCLRIDVHDDGRGATPCAIPGSAEAPTPIPGSGFGLVSMQQRAALLDGHVEARPDETGGFRVAARLPVHGS